MRGLIIIVVVVSCAAAAAGYESYQTSSYAKQSDRGIYGKYEDNDHDTTNDYAADKDNIIREYEYDKKNKGERGHPGAKGPICYEVLYSPPYPRVNSDPSNQQNKFDNDPPYVWGYQNSLGYPIEYDSESGAGILSKAPDLKAFSAKLGYMTGPKHYNGNTEDGAYWEMVFTDPNPLKIIGLVTNCGVVGYSPVSWVTSYLVEAQDKGGHNKELLEPLGGAKGTKIFQGNFDVPSFWYNYFKHPISPNSLRVYPLSANAEYGGLRVAAVVQKCVGDDITELLNNKNGYPGRNSADFGH